MKLSYHEDLLGRMLDRAVKVDLSNKIHFTIRGFMPQVEIWLQALIRAAFK